MLYPTKDDLIPVENFEITASEEGGQTIITDNIRRIADEINSEGKLSGLELVKEVCSYVRTLLPKYEELQLLYKTDPTKIYDKRARTADQLLSEDNLLPGRGRARNISGCIETGIVTRSLLLAKEVSCLYTETLMEKWCKDYGDSYDANDPNRPDMYGHVFVDFYDEGSGKWYTSDPNDETVTIHKYRDYTKDGERYIYPRSVKDSWDLGYRNMKDFQKAVSNFFKSQRH